MGSRILVELWFGLKLKSIPHKNKSSKHSYSYVVSSHGITHLLNAAHPGPDNSMTVDCRHIEQRYAYEKTRLLKQAFKLKGNKQIRSRSADESEAK